MLCAACLLASSTGKAGATEASLLLQGTVVTMDDAHSVIADGRVLIRGSTIVAVWAGSTKPPGIDTSGARVISAGKKGLIFPGLINLHDHPSYDVLPLWPPPSSHKQSFFGRPTGREPYDYRYEWSLTHPPEQLRLVVSPHDALTSPDALDLQKEALGYVEVRDVLAGETTTQGDATTPPNGPINREADAENFGRQRVDSWVPSLASGPPSGLLERMQAGTVDAWIVHLAEGVRDGDRVKGDPFSSRHEFDVLRGLGLLTDATVIVHGTALERADFTAMRAAPPVSASRPPDGLGAKLVWSPLSNLLLYGKTTNVYDALASGVIVSLGTDWTPSGSDTLLDELKIADIALRDRRILGRSRAEVPNLAAERALDRELVDMVTRNPAMTLRWPEVGSVQAGKHADLLVLRKPARSPTDGEPDSPYRNLIDATQRDVRLVLVDGIPVAGDPDAMKTAGAGPLELVRSAAGRFVKAVPAHFGLAGIERTLRASLRALGGDHAKRASGLPSAKATFSYLRTHWNAGLNRTMTEAAFRTQVLAPRYGLIRGRVNLERIELSPLFTVDDHFRFAVIGGSAKSGIPRDPAPPFHLYRANRNQVGQTGNPFAPRRLFNRWYRRRG